MGKYHGNSAEKFTGQVGDLIYQQRDGVGVVYSAPMGRDLVRHTYAQMVSRLHVAALIVPYRVLKPVIADMLEHTARNQNAYNIFLKHNIKRSRVFLTRQESEAKAAIVDHFQISAGPLTPVVEVSSAEGYYVSDISTGSLRINRETRLLDFANAVIANNNGRFMSGDVIRFVQCCQIPAYEDYQPDMQVFTGELRLETDPVKAGSATVWGTAGVEGFCSVEVADEGGAISHRLAYGVVENTLVAWVQMRHRANGKMECTDQCLYGQNTLLEQYTNDEAEYFALMDYSPEAASEFHRLKFPTPNKDAYLPPNDPRNKLFEERNRKIAELMNKNN